MLTLFLRGVMVNYIFGDMLVIADFGLEGYYVVMHTYQVAMNSYIIYASHTYGH